MDRKERIQQIQTKLKDYGQRLKTLGQKIQTNPNFQHWVIRGRKLVKENVDKYGWEFFGKILTVVLCAYFLSDLSTILIQELLPDTENARPKMPPMSAKRAKSLTEYDIIFVRNLFNSQGLIPGEGGDQPGGVPVRTSLPYELIGTVIFEDENLSVATLQDKSADRVYPVRVGDEIPSKIRVTKVEAYRVVFVNLQSNRNEYVDLPQEESNIQAVFNAPPSGGDVANGVKKVSETRVVVSRDKLDSTLTNLDQILTQARVVPNFENGQPAGFKIIQIAPGSIYADLGLRNNDVLVGINGQPIDAARAFGFLNEFKESKHAEITIRRDGKEIVKSLDVE